MSVLLADLHDFALVLAKQKSKAKLFVLTGQNTIAKQKKSFVLVLPKTKTKHKIVQVRLLESNSGTNEGNCRI